MLAGRECAAPARGGGDLRQGYRAAVRGKVTGHGASPLLAVTSVGDAEGGCAEGVTVPDATQCTATAGSNWFVVHGSLMMISWGTLLPVGVLSARLLKYLGGTTWFLVHRAVQPLGMSVALCGWVIALVNFDVFSASRTSAEFIHGCLGIIVMCLGMLQVVNALLRPHKDADKVVQSPVRVAWEYLHKISGYAAVILGMATCWIGTTLLPVVGDIAAFQIAYGVITLCMLVGVVVLLREGRAAKRQEEVHREENATVIHRLNQGSSSP